MERAQKAYRNFKNADAAFRSASANFKSRWPVVFYKYFGHSLNAATEKMNKEYHNSHQRMLNAYTRREKAYNNFINAAKPFNIPVKNVNTMKFALNQIKLYRPPNKPGGFGGLGYEEVMLRWRKKPNRAKSASPGRRRSPLKRAHSAHF